MVKAEKQLVFLANVGTHGHSYFPLKSKYLNLLKPDGEDIVDYEAKNITAMGMRHHYLIGQELRRRYIADTRIGTGLATNHSFLSWSYRIQEVFTRTSGNA
jgi:hypothetical protein